MLSQEGKTYRIIPSSSGVFIFFWVLVVFFVAVFAISFVNSGFEAVSIAVFVLVVLVVGGAIGFFVYQSRHAVFTITGQGLKIGPGFYGRFIPKKKINLSGVRVIDLRLEKDYQPKWRTNGAGLPGYAAGWFKLSNKEKALMFVTNQSSVVYIPTTEKYSVMLSVREADEMVKTIRQWK